MKMSPPPSRSGRLLAIAFVALACLLPAPRAGAVADADVDLDPDAALLAASDRLGDCLEREAPACATAAAEALEQRLPGSRVAAYGRAHADFLRGAFDQAAKRLPSLIADPSTPAPTRRDAERLLALSRATAKTTEGMAKAAILGGRFVVWHREDGPDALLVDLIEGVLRRAIAPLEEAFGALPTGEPIAVHVYPRVEDLAAVSGLTAEQIRTSGTIALCKYNRVMLTSPWDLVFGYHWADTLVHELVHYLVIKHGGAGVPVWLHEGLARGFEASWRGVVAGTLDRAELTTLAAARKAGRFITFAQMHPSMAALPSQEDAQLAFAEVHHAVAWMLEQHAAAHADERRSSAAGARALVERFGAGDSLDAALQAFVGHDLKGMQRRWRRTLRKVKPPPAGQPGAARPGRGSHGGHLVFKRTRGAATLEDWQDEAARFVALGDRLLAIERPVAAAIEYEKALDAGAEVGPLLATRLGRAYLAAGRAEDAVRVLEPASLEHAEHAPLWVVLADALVARGAPEQALKALEQAGWINPFDPRGAEVAVLAHRKRGDEPAARAAQARLDRLDTLLRR